MSVAGWIVIGVMTVIGVIDWLIVMGTKPRNWKGGEKDDRNMETNQRNHR